MMVALRPYPAYKDSGLAWLGPLPNHWGQRRMKFLFKERTQKGFPDEPLLAATQTKGVVRKDEYGKRTVTAMKDFHLLKLVEIGDFVISLRSFEGGIEVSHCRGIISPAYTVLKPSGAASLGYYSRFFKSADFIRSLTLFVTGIREGQNIDYERMSRAYMPLPPLDEQIAIGRFLAWANARLERTIRAKRRVIALLTEQKQAIIHRAVTRGLDPTVPLKPSGIAWLGDIPAHWEVRRLGRLAKVFNGTTPSRSNPAYWSNGTIPWLASGKVNDQIVTRPSELITARAFAASSLTLIPAGALVMGMVGQGRTRGMCAILAIEACINQNLAAIVSGPAILNQFLLNTLIASYRDIREFGRGGNQAALNCEIVGRLPVPVLPMEEQQAIVSHIESETTGLNTAISRLNREIDLLREYRTRLVADVVTGKLDVREAATSLPQDELSSAVEPEALAEDDDPEDLDEAETDDEETAT